MNKDPHELELQFRRLIEEAILVGQEPPPVRRGFRWRVPLIILAFVLGFGGLFFFIFAVSIKWTYAYTCSVAIAKRSPVVIAELGEPMEPGLLAWSFAYMHEFSTTDASFSTDLSGPKGEGKLRVHFYLSPVGSSLTMDLEKDGRAHVVHRGFIPQCQ